MMFNEADAGTVLGSDLLAQSVQPFGGGLWQPVETKSQK
jgi:hypothetical protein